MSAEDIFKEYAHELKRVDEQLLTIFQSNALPIPIIGRHVVSSGGKRIRPLFLLLSANLCGYRGENRRLLAAIVEAIHTASLLHDDVIDGAETRRGKPTAHALWGNQIVVLVGDFLYSNALRLAVAQESQKIMEVLSDATTRMTEGEILQLHKIGDPDITKEEYFEIISAKTGVLISAACRLGGILAQVSEAQETALAQFGLKAGIAFQLADDVLDYVADQKGLGKKLGKDLDEGKITMPLIYLLKVVEPHEADELKALIKEQEASQNGHQQHTGDQKNLNRILELFSKYHAIEESLKIAQALLEKARAELTLFPASKEKEALLAVADYALQRKS